MSLTIIAGKPGCGKTYHTATLLVDMLTDWARYELKEGSDYPSSVWTNIVFNEEGLNAAVSKRLGQEVDVWKYMNFCDDEFFKDPLKVYWWQKFPAQAVVIIDEVHFHLGKKVEYGSLDLEQELINWISTHRHTQQALYFISQHTDQFANQVLGIADSLFEIVNVKSMFLPFPISIPMSDLEELKRCFGIKTQYYQCNVGNFRGKAIRWSGGSQRNLMLPDIFRVYQSHDSGLESSDRPSLKMNALEGSLWFLRRHGWHLVPKMILALLLPFICWKVFVGMPGFLVAATSVPSVEQTLEVKQEEVKRESVAVKSGGSGSVKPVVGSLEGVSGVASSSGDIAASLPRRVSGAGEVRAYRNGGLFSGSSSGSRLVMLYEKGVMLDDGRKVSIGETVFYEGEMETLSVACATCGVICFESGKRLKF